MNLIVADLPGVQKSIPELLITYAWATVQTHRRSAVRAEHSRVERLKQNKCISKTQYLQYGGGQISDLGNAWRHLPQNGRRHSRCK